MYITILGNSNSGKSTIANYISDKYGFKTMSPARRLKQLLTTLDDRLYYECLEEVWAKNLNIPNNESTYLDLLVKFHHFFEKNYPEFPALCLKKELEQFENGVITSVRSMSCVKLLENYNNHYVVVYNKTSTNLTSDSNLKEILSHIGNKAYQINNVGDFQELYDKVDEFMCLKTKPTYIS